MAKLTLAEMQMIKNIDTFDSGKINVFYFPIVDSTTSHLLESLLYRLENLKDENSDTNKNYIYLADTSAKVRKKQISTGLFVERDLGKSRSEVLAERYSDLFTTKIFSGFRVRSQVVEFIKPKINLFYISSPTRIEENYDSQLASLKNVTGYRMSDGELPVVYLLNMIYNGAETAVQFNVIKDSKIVGSVQNIESTVVNTPAYDEFTRNSMTAQVCFNIINNIITDGMGVNYSQISGEYFQEKPLEKEFIFGLYDSAIFNKIDIASITTKYPVATLAKLSKEFDTFKSRNTEYLDTTYQRVQNRANNELALEFQLTLFTDTVKDLINQHEQNVRNNTDDSQVIDSRISEISENLEKYKVWTEFTSEIFQHMQSAVTTMNRETFLRLNYDLVAFFESKLGSLLIMKPQTV